MDYHLSFINTSSAYLSSHQFSFWVPFLFAVTKSWNLKVLKVSKKFTSTIHNRNSLVWQFLMAEYWLLRTFISQEQFTNFIRIVSLTSHIEIATLDFVSSEIDGNWVRLILTDFFHRVFSNLLICCLCRSRSMTFHYLVARERKVGKSRQHRHFRISRIVWCGSKYIYNEQRYFLHC